MLKEILKEEEEEIENIGLVTLIERKGYVGTKNHIKDFISFYNAQIVKAVEEECGVNKVVDDEVVKLLCKEQIDKAVQDERNRIREAVPKNYLEWKRNKGIVVGRMMAQVEVDELLSEILALLK